MYTWDLSIQQHLGTLCQKNQRFVQVRNFIPKLSTGEGDIDYCSKSCATEAVPFASEQGSLGERDVLDAEADRGRNTESLISSST